MFSPIKFMVSSYICSKNNAPLIKMRIQIWIRESFLYFTQSISVYEGGVYMDGNSQVDTGFRYEHNPCII